MPVRTVPSANKRDRACRWLWGRFPGEKALNIAANGTDAGGTGRLQTGPGKSEHSLWLGFASAARSAAEKLEPKTLRQSGPKLHFFRPRNMLFSPPCPKMGRQISSSESWFDRELERATRTAVV